MQNSKLISIIVPVYNTEKYLDSCLESLCGQSYKNIEIILVDNGSKDKSAAICKSYAEKDERIKYIYTSEKGVSNARNLGMEAAKGEYIAFADADDRTDKEMLNKAIKAMVAKNADVVIWGYRVCYKKQNGENIIIAHSSKDDILSSGFIWNKLYRKSLLKNIKFDCKLALFEDEEFNYKVFKQGLKYEILFDEYLYDYYIRRGSAIDLANKDIELYFKMYEWKIQNISALTEQHCYEKLEKTMSMTWVTYVLMYITANNKRYAEYVRLLVKSETYALCQQRIDKSELSFADKIVIKCLDKGYFMILKQFFRLRSARYNRRWKKYEK